LTKSKSSTCQVWQYLWRVRQDPGREGPCRRRSCWAGASWRPTKTGASVAGRWAGRRLRRRRWPLRPWELGSKRRSIGDNSAWPARLAAPGLTPLDQPAAPYFIVHVWNVTRISFEFSALISQIWTSFWKQNRSKQKVSCDESLSVIKHEKGLMINSKVGWDTRWVICHGIVSSMERSVQLRSAPDWCTFMQLYEWQGNLWCKKKNRNKNKKEWAIASLTDDKVRILVMLNDVMTRTETTGFQSFYDRQSQMNVPTLSISNEAPSGKKTPVEQLNRQG